MNLMLSFHNPTAHPTNTTDRIRTTHMITKYNLISTLASTMMPRCEGEGVCVRCLTGSNLIYERMKFKRSSALTCPLEVHQWKSRSQNWYVVTLTSLFGINSEVFSFESQ